MQLGHGHGRQHTYITGDASTGHGHGSEHAYVTSSQPKQSARQRPRHEIPEPGPVTMRYVRNPQSSKQYGDFAERYGQHIEPHGRYLSEQGGDHVPDGWESGEVSFQNPLHLPFGDDSYQHPNNWKHQLSTQYNGKRGKALSRAIAKDGHDAIITHDDYGTREIVDLTHLHKQAEFIPTQRLFGPTYGLDHRLFDQNGQLKPDVRRYILETLGDWWKPTYGVSWDEWAKVYFAGSEASEWTSPTLEGNGDFDVLIGVNYDAFRANGCKCHDADKTNQEITDELNANLRKLDEKTANAMIMVDGELTGPWDNTWYVNQDSWDIRKIRPYSAFNVSEDEWAVKPPHLPDWDISQFPEGDALVEEARAVASYVEAILKLPEPYRTQQGYALWQHLHSDRGRAFTEQGEGWYDPANVIEKWLDQQGLWEKLVEIMVKVKNDPAARNAPVNWSNDPHSS